MPARGYDFERACQNVIDGYDELDAKALGLLVASWLMELIEDPETRKRLWFPYCYEAYESALQEHAAGRERYRAMIREHRAWMVPLSLSSASDSAAYARPTPQEGAA